MPEKETLRRAAQDKREGKAPTTQAGEFIREEIDHIHRGQHGARSTKQAIAIGLSKARKAGVKLPPPPAGKASPTTRESARRAYKKGQRGEKKSSPRRSRAVRTALKREGREAASSENLSRQGRGAASKRSSSERSRAAQQAAHTKGPRKRRAASQKAARSRTSNQR